MRLENLNCDDFLHKKQQKMYYINIGKSSSDVMFLKDRLWFNTIFKVANKFYPLPLESGANYISSSNRILRNIKIFRYVRNRNVESVPTKDSKELKQQFKYFGLKITEKPQGDIFFFYD